MQLLRISSNNMRFSDCLSKSFLSSSLYCFITGEGREGSLIKDSV